MVWSSKLGLLEVVLGVTDNPGIATGHKTKELSCSIDMRVADPAFDTGGRDRRPPMGLQIRLPTNVVMCRRIAAFTRDWIRILPAESVWLFVVSLEGVSASIFFVQVSRLICFPNLAYSSTLSWVISSRIDDSFSSKDVDSSSSFSVACSSIS